MDHAHSNIEYYGSSGTALLSSLNPCPQCTTYSHLLECALSLSASLSDPSMPILGSLSVLPTTKASTVIDRITEIEGIEERLSDAIRGCDANFETQTPIVEKFLQRAEALFRELENALQNSSCRQSRSTDDKDDPKPMVLPAHFYSYVVSQLDFIGWENIVSIDSRLTVIVLKTVDSSGRTHELRLELGENFPNQAPICTSDLPIEFEIENWRPLSLHPDNSDVTSGVFTGNTNFEVPPKKRSRQSVSAGLALVYEEFEAAVDSYQSLWNELDNIDANACILEPILPARRSIRERRIAIRASAGGISAVLSLDCKRPRTVPSSLRFVGATAEVSKLRSHFNEYIAGTLKCDDGLTLQWREDRTVRENLELCFGDIPTKNTADGSEFEIECGICYTNRLGEDGLLPDACCGNACCARSYHEACLFEWLHSLPSARISFDRIFGTCPYCCEPISVKVRCARS
mmetsp:Transcript_2826/g.4433  ORF Transcript_2826/g.4433 Transcript_2826/m.4433 type:complete len:460 (-) Transcript_2826:115-1494(-)